MKKYSSLDERVMTNIISQANQDELIYRARARYPMLDIAASDFDLILTRNGIETHVDRKTGGKYYVVKDVKEALKRYLLQHGVRPKLNPEALK